jgi:hypothetical protein
VRWNEKELCKAEDIVEVKHSAQGEQGIKTYTIQREQSLLSVVWRSRTVQPDRVDGFVNAGLDYQSFCDHSRNFAWVNSKF